MSKKKTIIVLIIIAIVSLFAIVYGIYTTMQKASYNTTKIITIKNGKSDTDTFSYPIELKHTGTYNINIEIADLNNPPGFLTGVSIVSENNDCKLLFSASALTFGNNPIRLRKGHNEIVFTILANTDDDIDFAQKLAEQNQSKKETFEPWEGFKDGTYTVRYGINLRRSPADLAVIVSFFTVIFGLDFALLFATINRKGKSAVEELDERMLLARHKETSKAFYVTIAGLSFIYVINALGATFPAEPAVQILFVLLLGITVSAVGCIMHDGYFAINDNKTSYLVLFVTAAIVCLAASIFGFSRGTVVYNGKLTTGITPLFILIMLLTVIVSIIIKDRKDRSEE